MAQETSFDEIVSFWRQQQDINRAAIEAFQGQQERIANLERSVAELQSKVTNDGDSSTALQVMETSGEKRKRTEEDDEGCSDDECSHESCSEDEFWDEDLGVCSSCIRKYVAISAMLQRKYLRRWE